MIPLRLRRGLLTNGNGFGRLKAALEAAEVTMTATSGPAGVRGPARVVAAFRLGGSPLPRSM